MEGVITIFVGFQAMWLLPNYVSSTSIIGYQCHARCLTSAERQLAQECLAEDSAEALIFKGFKMAIEDPYVPVFMLVCCSQWLGLSFVNLFPTLTSTLRCSTPVTFAPPWIFASICTFMACR
ncbi:hypothetical protein EDD22DRAFT_906319, partial [Suillus occidentalis]